MSRALINDSCVSKGPRPNVSFVLGTRGPRNQGPRPLPRYLSIYASYHLPQSTKPLSLLRSSTPLAPAVRLTYQSLPEGLLSSVPLLLDLLNSLVGTPLVSSGTVRLPSRQRSGTPPSHGPYQLLVVPPVTPTGAIPFPTPSSKAEHKVYSSSVILLY